MRDDHDSTLLCQKSNESQMFKFDPKQEYNTNDKTNAVIPETFFLGC